MLTFESPFFEEEGIILFRDHADPTLFHYLAGPPRLTRGPDGHPHLLLIKYRRALEALGGAGEDLREQLGGGFLMFGVDCGIDDSTKQRLRTAMQARLPPTAGAVSLVPVLYSDGKVSVLALDAASSPAPAGDEEAAATKFVTKVLGTAKPSLLQDQRAVFSLSLSSDGVTLLEEAYRSELSPIGVMYELEFAGLRPALAVVAKANLKRVADKLAAEFGVKTGQGTGGGASGGGNAGSNAGGSEGGNTERRTEAAGTAQGQSGAGTAFDLKLQAALEWLKDESAIEIEVIRQQAGESVDAMERQAMDLLKESILKQFFQPVMTTQPINPATVAQQLQQATTQQINRGQGAGGSQVEIGLRFSYTHTEEDKVVTYDYRVQAPETRIHAPNGFFTALVDGSEQARHIREVDLDDEFFRVLDVDVRTTADFEALDLSALTVELQYGGSIEAPEVTGTVVFTPTAHEPRHFRAALDRGDHSYRYRLGFKFGGTAEADAQSRTLDWRRATTRALVVHPPEDLEILNVLLEPGRVDWEIIDSIETRLRYAHEPAAFVAERTFMFRNGTEPQRWTVRLPVGAAPRYTIQHTWHLKGGNTIASEAQPATDRRVFINDPFVDRLPIIVDPQVDPEEVLRIVVELQYEDEDNGLRLRKTVELVAPEYRATTVPIPIMDADKREYSFEVRLVKKGGLTEDREPQTTDALSVVITPGGFLLDVSVALLGALDQLQLTAVQVDLRAEPLEGKPPEIKSLLFLPGDTTRVSQRLLVRADRAAVFDYKVQLFMVDGRVIETEWRAHERQILPIPLAALIQDER